MANDIDAASAQSALNAIHRARGTAGTPRPAPAWYPPARGVLAAVAYALLTGPWCWRDWQPVAVVGGILAAVAFLAVHWAAVRPGGVLVWPAPPVRRKARMREQWQGALAYGLGWTAALVGGWAAGAVTSAVLLGVLLGVSSFRTDVAVRAGRA